MIRSCLFILLILLLDSALAQITPERGSREWYQETAKEQLAQLKGGALLVRLHENQIAINAALERGLDRRAEIIRNEVRQKNLEVINAMEEHFDFCEVYYFFASDSKFVSYQQWDSVQFVNPSYEPDPGIKPSEGYFLVAELTLLRSDTARFKGDPVMRRDSEGDLYQHRTSTKSPDPMFEAIVIKSLEFVQLHDPFPYWVRTWGSLPWKRKMGNVVKTLNEHMWERYKRWGLATRPEE